MAKQASGRRSGTAQDRSEFKGVRFSPRECRRLEHYAETRGQSFSEVIRTAVNMLLDAQRVPDPGPVGEDEAPAPRTVGDILRDAMRAQREPVVGGGATS